MKNALVLLALIAGLTSCRKELDKPSWDTEVLAPLLSAKLNVNNLLPDSILQSNADSSLRIVYSNDLYALNMDTLFNIPDTTLHEAYSLPGSFTLAPGTVVVNNALSETTYDLNGAALRTIRILSGKVRYEIRSKIREKTVFQYSMPCAKLAGVPFSINVLVPAATASSPGVFSQTYDLSGYEIDLTGPSGNDINTIYTSLLAKVDPAAPASVVVNPGDSVVIDNTFFDIIPSYARGYFGSTTTAVGPETSDFSLFSRITDGTISLEDVNFSLDLENFIGMDSRVKISSITSINNRTGNTVSLSNSLINSSININRAAESGGVVYPTYANFPLTTANSNIKAMIENLPDQFGYQLEMQTNPLGNVSGSNDFVYTDKLFRARMNMDIPLSLVATNLTLTDTLAFELDEEDDRPVKEGNLTLVADNGFPFDARIQFYMLRSDGTVSDSLIGRIHTIDEAPLNPSLRAVGKKRTRIVIPVTEEKLNRLYQTRKMLLAVRFNTSAQPSYVKIYSDYGIDVQLIGDFRYTIQMQ